MSTRKSLVAVLIVAALSFAGCGGGGSSTPVTVTISANANSVETFQTVQFSATVTGTTNQAVTWSLSCTATATTVTACGTISASSTYVAPNTVPTIATANSTDPAVVTVTAISQAQSSAGDSVQFNVNSLNQQALAVPVQLGSSGGNANAFCSNSGTCTGGTLGSLVSGGGKTYILSNNHVLGLSDGASVGQEVTQPGIIETNCETAGTINVATVADIISLETQPIPATPVDVTTGLVTSGQVDLTDNILELGALSTVNGVQVPQPAPPVSGSGMAGTVGQLLAKSGRTTGLTCSAVEMVDLSMQGVIYTKGCTTTNFTVTYSDLIEVENMTNGQSFIANGDSGSLAVDAATAQPVALMFAGDANSSIGSPVADVLAALKATNAGATFTFVGTATPHAVPGCGLPGLSSVTVTPQSAKATGSALQNANAALTRNAAQILNTQGVTAYSPGMSLDSPKEPAILVFAAPGTSHAGIPPEIDGVRTRIIETGYPAAQGALSQQQAAQLAAESAAAQPTAIPASAIENARRVKEKHAAELMSDPAVQGVGVGASFDSPGEPAIGIFVLKNKPHQPIPPTIDGIRTRIKETTGFRAIVDHSPNAASCSARKSTHLADMPAGYLRPIQPVATAAH
ncbi:MAG: hypothetical protein WA361_07940 [Candidatus Acidiferrales bacterium]